MPKVLLIDDDHDLLDMVCRMIEVHNMEVLCLDNGEHLVEELETSKADIIVMDIFLGEADGRDLCRQLKSNPAYSGIPIVLYSAGNITGESIKESMADAFLPKPFEMGKMIGLLTRLTEKRA